MHELRIYIQGYKYFKTLKTNKRIIYINSGLTIPSPATLLMGKKGFDLKDLAICLLMFYFRVFEEQLTETCHDKCCDQCHLLTVKDLEDQRGKRDTLPLASC